MFFNINIASKNTNHFKMMFLLTFYQKININIKLKLLKSDHLTLNPFGLNIN